MLGTAVDRAAVGRDELFVTTVVPYGRLGERGTRESIHASLERLGLDHLDAVFVSAPLPGWDVAGTAAALNSIPSPGLLNRLRIPMATPTSGRLYTGRYAGKP